MIPAEGAGAEGQGDDLTRFPAAVQKNAVCQDAQPAVHPTPTIPFSSQFDTMTRRITIETPQGFSVTERNPIAVGGFSATIVILIAYPTV